ncbi:MAG: hypothetical protein JNK30_01025 [Phenylobacterium sp.]|uniref:hypothetical protein n=1 Tax=Phenylobacterium sp. TaxID=1871053 RepID=UPI001A41E429|nr:hypothetical protein [Phenylobacterium sp.]MBL8769937.1 hypothetical protein [Phenylobacterium sp.]
MKIAMIVAAVAGCAGAFRLFERLAARPYDGRRNVSLLPYRLLMMVCLGLGWYLLGHLAAALRAGSAP